MRGQRDAYTFLRFTAKNCSCIPSGRTIREVAKRFMVTKRTVHRLVQQYKQTQDLTPKKVGTKRVGILEQNQVAILAIVEEYPDTVYLSIKGYKKPPSFSRLRIIDSRQVGFNCIP
jgi:hypothetical protein